MKLINEIPELLKADIISQQTADKILEYYGHKGKQSHNRLIIVFGILGAILIGLGIILIIAHNWDDFSKTSKTIFAFFPLLAGQIINGYVLLKKQESVSWREGASAFLFFAVGASISMVSQIYNIPGDLSSFLLTWMLLCLPLMYVMKSSIVSLLYIIGITWYATNGGYWSYSNPQPLFFWLLFIAVLPYYYLLYKNKPHSNFMVFHNWLVPLSVVISLGTVAKSEDEFMFVAYISLFGLLYLIGTLPFFKKQKLINNGFIILGSLGTIFLLLMLSFDWFWIDLQSKVFQFNEVIRSAEFISSAIVSIIAGVFLIINWKNKGIKEINLIEIVFILFIIVFFIGFRYSISIVLINLIVFAIGLLTIRSGAKQNHLGILNYGLLILTALIVCRFFDTTISFIIRGLLFVLVGVGFFVANYGMLKKRKENG